MHFGGEPLDIALGVQCPVEVKPALFGLGEFELRVIILDVLADGGGLEEVHRRTFDRGEFAGRNQGGIHRGVVAGMQGGDVFEDVVVTRAGKVEVTVVGEVEHRRFVGAGLVVDVQFVFVVEAVGDLGFQVAGEAHLTVLGQVGEGHADRVLAFDLLGLPHMLVETLGAAMQRVGAIVERHLVALAVEFKGTAGQAIAEAPDGCTKKCSAALIALHVIEAQHHVIELAVFVRHLKGLQHATVGDHGGLHAMAVTQHVLFDGGAVIGFAERFLLAGQAGGMGAAAGDQHGQRQAGKQVPRVLHGRTSFCCFKLNSSTNVRYFVDKAENL